MRDEEVAVAVLNSLLTAESGSLVPRLAETSLFAHLASADELAAVQRMAVESREYERWLTEAIIALRGAPAPRLPDPSVADTHYVSVEWLLPRVIATCRRLVEAYRQAAGRVASSPAAAGVVTRVMTRHEHHLEILEGLRKAHASS